MKSARTQPPLVSALPSDCASDSREERKAQVPGAIMLRLGTTSKEKRVGGVDLPLGAPLLSSKDTSPRSHSALPQRRVVWMWFGAFPGAFGLGRAQPQRRGTSPWAESSRQVLCAQAWKPGSQHAGEKRGVAGLLLGRTERAARAAELQLCAQAR